MPVLNEISGTFKGRGFFPGTEGDGGFNLPGTIFLGMGDLPGIMSKKTSF
jgi:hypothetical protein